MLNALRAVMLMLHTHAHTRAHAHTGLVFLISTQVEDGCCSIMLMNVCAVQSHASLTEQQAEDADGSKRRRR